MRVKDFLFPDFPDEDLHGANNIDAAGDLGSRYVKHVRFRTAAVCQHRRPSPQAAGVPGVPHRAPWAARVMTLVAGCALFLSGAARAQTAGVTVSPTALSVDEGSTNTYTIQLTGKQPTANVTITVSKESGGDGDLSADTDTGTVGDQTTLTFMTSNWNTAQTVTVSAAQDTDAAAGTATFEHAATSTDTDYNGISISDVTATEVDDEAGICGRTKQVRDVLVMGISGASTCAEVTTAQLATVTTLGLVAEDLPEKITSLRASDFDGLTALTSLTLDRNLLTSLPDLSQLTALEQLGLVGNRRTSLPDLSKLTNLRQLHVRGNQLTALPDLSKLTKLTNLNPQDNRLTALPDLSKLTNLQYLAVQKNRLTVLPDLSKNTELVGLHVDDNQLTALPDLSKNTKLESLDAHDNRLTALPDLSKNTELQRLYARGNRLTALPDLSKLTKLTHLYANENRLTALPDLSKNTNLGYLLVQYNSLTALPDLSKSPNLKQLFVHVNQLTALPDLSRNTALTHLIVAFNRLTSLPDLSRNTGLLWLYAQRNRLTSLPDLSALTALTILRFEYNPLSNLSALTLTDADGNPIALNGTFAGDTVAYTAYVGSDVASVKVTPTAADTGTMPTRFSTLPTYPAPTIKVGPQGGTLTPVASGSASGPIALSPDGNAVIDVQVSGRAAVGSIDGVRGTKTYTITIREGQGPSSSLASAEDVNSPGSQLLFIADTGINARDPAGSDTPDSRSVSDRSGETEAAQKNFISVANTNEEQAVTVLFQYHNDEMRRVLWYLRVLRAGATVLVDPFDHEIPGAADGEGGRVNVKDILFDQIPALSSKEKAGFNSGRFVIAVTAVGANTVDNPDTDDADEANTAETANILFPTFLARDLHGMDNIDNCGELRTAVGSTAEDDNLEYTRHGADGDDDCSKASDAAGRDDTSRNVGDLSIRNYRPMSFNYLVGHHTAARILPDQGEGIAWGVDALPRSAITVSGGASADRTLTGAPVYTVLDGTDGARLAPKVHGGAEAVNAASDDDNQAVDQEPTASDNNRVVNGGALVWPALHRTSHREQRVQFLSVADDYGDPGQADDAGDSVADGDGAPGKYRLLAAKTLYRIHLRDARGNVLSDESLELPVFGGLPVPEPPPSLYLLVDGIGVRPNASPADCSGDDRVEGWSPAELTDIVPAASTGGKDFAGLDAAVDPQTNASPGWVEFRRTPLTCTRDFGDGDPSDSTSEIPDGVPAQDKRRFIGGTLVVEKETANRTFVTAGQVVVRFLTPHSAFAASWWLREN